jgi:hypothetical protein
MTATHRRVGRRAALATLLALALAPGRVPGAEPAGEAWKAEFAEVCSKTQDAMALTSDELRGLVERCDRLKPVLEQLDEPVRKVYTRRVQACRDLYQFVLDTRAPGVGG